MTDLKTIVRPDASYWEFQYSNASLPGYMTRMDLVTSTGIRRVMGAWEYDTVGNVVKSWKGDVSFTGPNAIDKLSYAWTNPVLPTQLVVTDALSPATASTYVIERDSNSSKPKVKSISGDCPICGAGPNSSYDYADGTNPLLPTRVTDGSGKKTDFVYNANGLTTAKTEAATTTSARTTSWVYGSSLYPGLVTQIDRPSTASGSFVRRTEYLLNANGDPTTIRETGREGGVGFIYDTGFTYNGAGMVLTVDPPTPGTADVVTNTYDPLRGGLIPVKRSEPTIGGTTLETTYAHDPFNRKISEIDVNGVETVTTFDSLNRIDLVTRKAAAPVDDLVTDYTYNGFGDLELLTRPLGNLVDYVFSDTNGDLAKGRLTAIEKKLNASTPGERIAYIYDNLGRKSREEMQSWNGSSWVAESFKDYEYYGRCQLKKVIDAAGNAQETHYDCAGNVDKVWDAAHPSASQTAAASTSYTYDALNRVSTVSQPWAGAGGGISSTTYGYDVQDHLTSVLEAVGGSTSFVYSDRDRMTSQTSEVSGVTTYTYNARGSLATELDARGVLVSRNYDAMNRPATVGALPAIDYPTAGLDVNYVWGSSAGLFEKGRLKTISNSTASVSYGYDRFGRMTQDGALSFSFDRNDNATQITYPGGVFATYSFDFADRQVSLSVTRPGFALEAVVSSATYRPFGPLKTFAFGGGPTVTRATDSRYLVDRISTSNGVFDWDYTVDPVGNPTAINDQSSVNQDRSFGYQDYTYFLTAGSGPWGTKGWTYDRIGNRRTEVRGAVTDTYSYTPVGGHDTSKLAQIAIGGGGGTKTYSYNAAGDGTGTVLGGSATTYVIDDAHRMIDWTATGATSMAAAYDGRGLLNLTQFPPSKNRKESRFTFSTSGVLMTRSTIQLPGPLEIEDYWYFSFAGLPVALWRTNAFSHGSPIETFIVDHLGTPVAWTTTPTTNAGFDPFGVDYATNLNNFDADHIFPGQTVDIFQQPNPSLYYNVNRWYEAGTGRYTSKDIRPNAKWLSDYAYGMSRPQYFLDPLGLAVIEVPITWPDSRCGKAAGCSGTEFDIECYCHCMPAGDWLATVTSSPGDTYFFYATNCTTPAADILAHERAHGADRAKDIRRSSDRARLFSGRRYSSRDVCEFQCDFFEADVDAAGGPTAFEGFFHKFSGVLPWNSEPQCP